MLIQLFFHETFGFVVRRIHKNKYLAMYQVQVLLLRSRWFEHARLCLSLDGQLYFPPYVYLSDDPMDTPHPASSTYRALHQGLHFHLR